MSVNIQTSDGLVKIAGTPTIDTSFSNISKNPVQNNVITQKFEQIDSQIRTQNSNLSQLEQSEVAGGKNLWSIGDIKVNGGDTNKVLISSIFKSNTQYTIKLKTKSFTSSDMGQFEFIYTDGTKTIISWDKSIGGAYATTSEYGNTIDIIQWRGWNYGEYAEFIEIQLEEGDTATSYEPYIPSVKMLAEENAQQSNSTVDMKMLGWTVPRECPIQNEVNGNQFIQKVGRIDLSTLSFSELGNFGYYVVIPTSKAPINNSTVANIYLEGFTTVKRIDLDSSPNSIAMTESKEFCINNGKIAIPSGYLYYELETPITMTIDGNEVTERINESLSVIGKCKNLLNPTLKTTTQNGVTCTNNGDGTYTLNGTATNLFQVIVGEVEIKGNQQYKTVGCPNNIINKEYCLIPYNVTDNTEFGKYDYGDGTINASKKDITYRLYIFVASGTTLSNLVFKPMLTTNLNATYDDYEPYTGDGETLTHDVAELKNDLEWKLLADNVAVGTSTNVVSGAREYYVVAKYGTINIITLIPSIVLGKTIFDGHYSSASDNSRIQINTTTSALSLASFIYGGSVKDDATYSVYYR